MNPIEIEGRTVAEAVETAVRQSGLRRDQVEIAVLQEESSGFMGLGAKPARVRLTEKRWGPDSPAAPAAPPAPSRPARAPRPEPRSAPRPVRREEPRREKPRREAPRAAAPHPVEPRPAESRPRRDETPSKPLTPAEAAAACEKARALVAELLGLMKIAAPTVSVSWDADMERVKAVVESQDAPLLVGRDGRVLESLQFLATLMLSRGADVPLAVQVDALSYWEKKEQAVLDQARRGAESVRLSGQPYRLEPMDAAMRRLIHRTLSSDASISTGSEGEGPWRKIVIRPRR